MSFLSWLFGKGIAGAISSDLIKKYKGIKLQHPGENDGKILERVWGFWLTLNGDKIISEDDEDKVVRLSIIKEKSEGNSELDQFSKFKTLFDLYQDILYIETEVSSQDGKTWDNSMKVFLKESAKNGFDFSKEYNSYKRILGGGRYRDRNASHETSLPHHRTNGSVFGGSADQAESDPRENKSK